MAIGTAQVDGARGEAVAGQVISEGMGEAYLRLKLKDQHNAIAMIEADPELKDLKRSVGPFLDLEVRGLPALRYFGDIVWRGPEGSGPLSDLSSGAPSPFFFYGSSSCLAVPSPFQWAQLSFFGNFLSTLFF